MNGSPTVLYNGAVRLDFEPKGHTYTVTDERGTRNVPSVTEILKIIDKSGPLTQWAANMTTEYIKQAIRPGLRYDELQLSQVIDQARFNFRSVSRGAKTIGSLVHEWIEAHLRARLYGSPELALPMNDQARAACGAAARWIAEHFVPRAMEHRLYSREHDFAGTLDVFGDVDGEPSIVDWKTSKGIYDEFRLQTAPYAAAWAEMHDARVPNRWLVRLDKETGELEPAQFPRDEFRRDLRGFLAAKTLHLTVEAIKRPRAAAKQKPIAPAAVPAPAPAARPAAPVPASIPPMPYVNQGPQQKSAVPAANGNGAHQRTLSQPAVTVAQLSSEPRRPSYRKRRRAKQISYLEMGGALVLGGSTYPLKDDLSRLGGRVSKAGDDWIWQVPVGRMSDLANLCAQRSIQLVAAGDGSLHLQRA